MDTMFLILPKSIKYLYYQPLIKEDTYKKLKLIQLKMRYVLLQTNI